MSRPSFAAMQRTDEARHLLRNHHAWALACWIAMRARWADSPSVDGLQPGEAFLGDWREMGFRSRKQYRVAMTCLKRGHLGAFTGAKGGAMKGTRGRLVNTALFDLFLDARGQAKGHAPGRFGAKKGPLTIQIEDKPRQRGAPEATPPTLTEVLSFASEIGHDRADAERYHARRTATGWLLGATPIRDWQADFNSWRSHYRGDANQGANIPAEEAAAALSAWTAACKAGDDRTKRKLDGELTAKYGKGWYEAITARATP